MYLFGILYSLVIQLTLGMTRDLGVLCLLILVGFMLKNLSTFRNFKYIYDYQFLGNSKLKNSSCAPRQIFKKNKDDQTQRASSRTMSEFKGLMCDLYRGLFNKR